MECNGNDECVCLKAKFSLSTGEPQSMMGIQNLKIVEEGLTKDGCFVSRSLRNKEH